MVSEKHFCWGGGMVVPGVVTCPTPRVMGTSLTPGDERQKALMLMLISDLL